MAQITYFAGLSDGDDTEECNTAESDTTEGDTAEGDTTEGDTTEGDTTEGDTTEGDTTEGDTAEGDTAEGDTAEGDNLNLRRLKRKRADDDDQSGELVSVDIFICNDATDGAHTSAKPGGAVQSWPVLASVIVFIARVHLWSTFIVLSQYS